MLRYGVLGLVGIFAGAAWAQQAPPPEGPPAASASPAPVQPSKAVVTMEEPLPGDHWTYEVRDQTTGKVRNTETDVVTEVTPTDVSMRLEFVRPDKTYAEAFHVLDRSWNLLMDGSWRYEPFNGVDGINAPLAVGKTWAFESSETDRAAQNFWRRSGTSRVIGQETVTTRAGTFETFKIETTSSSRNVSYPTTQEITMTSWYAPAIDHWVKRTSIVRVDNNLKQDTFAELVEYGRLQQAPPPEGTPTPSPLTPAAEPSKAAVSLQERLPGDHWTYEKRDEITGTVSTQTNIVTEVAPTDVSVRYHIVRPDGSGNEGVGIYDRSWNVIRDGSLQYFPYGGFTGIQAPLAVGKDWAFQSKAVNTGNGFIWNQSGTSKVVGHEAVTTRAGRFETFKIETTTSSSDFKDPTRTEDATIETWYAPAIAHWVKRSWINWSNHHLRSNATYELVEFGRNP